MNSSGRSISDARRFELLVESVTDYAIFMLDPQGFVSSWNEGAVRIKGYSPEEIIGQHYSKFFTEDDRRKGVPERNLSQALRTGRCEAEGYRIRKGGARFWASAILQTIRDDRGELIGFAEITRDMSERRAAQDALIDSERRFRLFVEGVVDYAIYMLDPSGIVINWNTGAERLKGYSAREIIGQHFSKFYTPEDRAAGKPAAVLALAAQDGRFEAEGWRVRKDGSRFWASVVVDAIRSPDGNLIGFAKVTRDVTERRAAQDALRDSERQFRLLVAGVTDYALYMLDPNGIVSSWNAGAQRIKGYAAEEIVGQHFSRFYTERERAAGKAARALEIAAREGRYEAEGWRVRKDGSMFWANAIVDAIRDERGELIGFAKITRDITERRNAQLALQEAQDQRAYLQKMDALGQLTGGIAHDFNNLLMVISGHIRLLKAKAAGDDRAMRAADAIELAARRGQSLTRQLLTFARRQTFNPEVLKLSEHVSSFESMLSSSLGNAISLSINIRPSTWQVRVDAGELELALVNLVLNARDAMPGGGTVGVLAENVALDKSDTPAGVSGEFVAIRVSDTGTGIADDILEKVFDPFFTTKELGKGTGLGLSQVHGFAHQSGGTVTISSELGSGTTVTLYLPRSQEEASQPPDLKDVETIGGGKVLVVDDNPEVADVTAHMLRDLGYEVKIVSGPSQALEQVAGSPWDLVITDVVMPGPVNGLALARHIRQSKPGVPVLLVTGYAEAASQVGIEYPILKKPFELADLSRAAERLIGESRQPSASNLVRLRSTPRG